MTAEVSVINGEHTYPNLEVLGLDSYTCDMKFLGHFAIILGTSERAMFKADKIELQLGLNLKLYSLSHCPSVRAPNLTYPLYAMYETRAHISKKTPKQGTNSEGLGGAG